MFTALYEDKTCYLNIILNKSQFHPDLLATNKYN